MANNAGIMRTLTDHIVAGDTAPQLSIAVLDEPGAGGANHEYLIAGGEESRKYLQVSFQNGPIKEVGVNGITETSLLSILIDRLKSFQAGAFSSEHNANALESCEAALFSLQERTRERVRRGVEGTSQK